MAANQTIQTILNQVLKEIKPDEKKLKIEVDRFISKLQKEIDKNKVKAKAVVGGSVAKGTFLKGDHDCDIFVKFDYSEYKEIDKKDSQALSRILKKIFKLFKPELIHGSRDYFQIKDKGKKGKINYEVVPVLDIKDYKKAQNVTDMSPLHVEWVKKNSTTAKRLVDQIRLAKKFCKAINVYGAESYIMGFSGHVLDILAIHYDGFLNLLKESQKWKYNQVIDPLNFYKGKAKQKLNISKIQSALIIIDPVDPSRNAAAALGKQKFERFKRAAKLFLEKPDKHFFVQKKVSVNVLKKLKLPLAKKIIILQAKPKTGKEDVIGAKLLKGFTLILNQLKFHDFTVFDADWVWNKDENEALFWYIIQKNDLPPVAKWVGPPLKSKKNVSMFKQKHPDTFVEKNRVCTYVKREFVNAENFVQNLIKIDENLKLKVKSIKIIKKVKK